MDAAQSSLGQGQPPETRSKIYRCDSGLTSLVAMDSKDSNDLKNPDNDSIDSDISDD